MTIDDVYRKIQEYTVLATGFDDSKIIFANQSKPRPKKPFISINLNSFKKIGHPILRKMDNQGIQTVVTNMKCTAGFSSYGDDLHSSELVLHKLLQSFDTELQNRTFNGEISLLKILKTVQSVSVEMNEQMESVSVLDLEFAFLISNEDNVGIIEKVEVEDKISNHNFIIG